MLDRDWMWSPRVVNWLSAKCVCRSCAKHPRFMAAFVGKFFWPCVINRKYLPSHLQEQLSQQLRTIRLTFSMGRSWEQSSPIGPLCWSHDKLQGTKLWRRHRRVTSVRPLHADWLIEQAAPVLSYSQKDSIHKLKTKDLQLKYLDERPREPKQSTVISRRKSV